MSALKKLLGVAAVVVLAFLAFRLWQDRTPGSGEETVNAVQARISQAHPVDTPGALNLRLLPSPGDTWRQVTDMRAHGAESSTFDAPLEYNLGGRIVSGARVRAGDNSGEVVIEHTVTEATMTMELLRPPQPPETMRAAVEAQLREREASLRHATVRETLDAQGRQVKLEMTIPGVPPHAVSGMELALRSLLIPPANSGGQPLTPGVSWTDESAITSLQNLPVSTTCTVDRVEEIDGDRVAVIRSSAESHFDVASGHSIDVGTTSDPRQGTAQITLQRLDLTSTGEHRHRLSDGRRILETERTEDSIQVGILLTSLTGQRQEGTQNVEAQFETVTQIEYP